MFPNVAVIDELRAQNPKKSVCEFFYIGQKGAIEEKIMSKCGVPFYGIHAGKLRRYFSLRNFVDLFKTPLGFFEALAILRRKKPDLVFAKGGYVSVPVALAARLLKIPVWLHESDVTPGLSNKICGRFAQKIWLSFPETKEFFESKNVEVVGNPIRKWILKGDASRGYKITGFSEKKPVILIIGGSTGAQSLNKIIFEIMPELLKKAQVVHVTGNISPYTGNATLARKFESAKGYKRFDFLDEDLAHVYSIADLIVSRAGSGGIFESLALTKPLILVPLPKSTSRGDQVENAEVFEKNGFALMLDQDQLSSERFLNSILSLLENESMRSKMVQNQKKAHYKNAAEKIAKAIISS